MYVWEGWVIREQLAAHVYLANTCQQHLIIQKKHIETYLDVSFILNTEYACLSVLLHIFDLRIINKYHQLMLIEFVNLNTLIFLEVVEVCRPPGPMTSQRGMLVMLPSIRTITTISVVVRRGPRARGRWRLPPPVLIFLLLLWPSLQQPRDRGRQSPLNCFFFNENCCHFSPLVQYETDWQFSVSIAT